jgi:uncharacterized membrane protein YdjX (TVP38/TMEM64 family)
MKSLFLISAVLFILQHSVFSFSPLSRPAHVLALGLPSKMHTKTGARDSSHLNLSSLDELNIISSSVVQSDLLPTGVFDGFRDQIAAIALQGGPPIMALAVALADSIPLVPTQPISIVAGALFGIKLGLPAVIFGQTMATMFAFIFGRNVLANSDWNVFENTQGADKNKLAKVLEELTVGLNSGDPKTVFFTIFLARQSPVLPFSLGNYFVGAATKAPILPALAGTVLGCLPLNLVWVGAGAGGMAAVDMVKENGLLAEGLEGFGALVTLGLVAAVVNTVKKVYSQDEAEAKSITEEV